VGILVVSTVALSIGERHADVLAEREFEQR